MIETSKIHNESCLDTMKRMDDGVIDLICCDPPYGYSFMGKDWDKVVMGVEYWQECLRVLKPGAFAFVMAAPRQDVLSRQIIRLQDAGFEVGFSSIYWAYASGFPKAGNIGKMVDKRRKGERNGKVDEFATYIKSRREKLNLTKGYVDKEICDGSSMYSFYEGRNNENGDWAVYLPTKERYEKIKKLLQMGDRFDDFIDNTVKVVNTKDGDFGYQKDGDRWDNEYKITEPNSDEAKELDGSYAGYQPKPAVEVVIVAMKPLSEKTFIDQALKNKKGITWLDDCRVPYESDGDKESGRPGGKISVNQGSYVNREHKKDIVERENESYQPQGRFPANLLVSDGVVDDGEERSSNTRQPTGKENIYDTSKGWNQNQISDTTTRGCNDSGTFSRYFDLDKWWGERIKELPKKVQKSYPFLIVPKAGKSEKNKGCEGISKKARSTANKMMGQSGEMKTGSGNDRTTEFHNNHPTVKPVKLMSYLITLGSRPDDIIYDPFCGSGTTLIAAEITRRKWIGSELSPEYHKIAEERIKRELHQLKLF